MLKKIVFWKSIVLVWFILMLGKSIEIQFLAIFSRTNICSYYRVSNLVSGEASYPDTTYTLITKNYLRCFLGGLITGNLWTDYHLYMVLSLNPIQRGRGTIWNPFQWWVWQRIRCLPKKSLPKKVDNLNNMCNHIAKGYNPFIDGSTYLGDFGDLLTRLTNLSVQWSSKIHQDPLFTDSFM